MLVQALSRLGFQQWEDFIVEDNSDGNGEFISQWHSELPQPTKDEIEVAHAEWQAEQDATKYQRNRKSEYPSIEELVVALWENVVEERAASVISLEATRQAIKNKYPKE